MSVSPVMDCRTLQGVPYFSPNGIGTSHLQPGIYESHFSNQENCAFFPVWLHWGLIVCPSGHNRKSNKHALGQESHYPILVIWTFSWEEEQQTGQLITTMHCLWGFLLVFNSTLKIQFYLYSALAYISILLFKVFNVSPCPIELAWFYLLFFIIATSKPFFKPFCIYDKCHKCKCNYLWYAKPFLL